MADDTQCAINAAKNGPLIVKGSITITDFDGTPIRLPGGAATALCRCGASHNKPFCDGQHVKVGFDGTLNPENKA